MMNRSLLETLHSLIRQCDTALAAGAESSDVAPGLLEDLSRLQRRLAAARRSETSPGLDVEACRQHVLG
jgi:hypothetical protein